MRRLAPAAACLAALLTLAPGGARGDAIDDDGMDWPGPRIFPGTGLLFSLFVLLADLEALPRIMNDY